MRKLSIIIFLDVATPWIVGFQDPATPVIIGIVHFYNHLIFFLVVIGVFVCWLLYRALTLFNSSVTHTKTSKFTHSTQLEVVWTIVPICLLLLIAGPSFALLYSIDEGFAPLVLSLFGGQPGLSRAERKIFKGVHIGWSKILTAKVRKAPKWVPPFYSYKVQYDSNTIDTQKLIGVDGFRIVIRWELTNVWDEVSYYLLRQDPLTFKESKVCLRQSDGYFEVCPWHILLVFRSRSSFRYFWERKSADRKSVRMEVYLQSEYEFKSLQEYSKNLKLAQTIKYDEILRDALLVFFIFFGSLFLYLTYAICMSSI